MDVLVFGPWPNELEEEGFECYAAFEEQLPLSTMDELEIYNDYDDDDDMSGEEQHPPKQKRGRRYLEWFQRHLTGGKKLHKLAKSDDDASVATATTAASSACVSECSTTRSDELSMTAQDGMPLIQTRLLNSGVDIEFGRDFEFVVDRVSKEVLGLEGTNEEEEKKEVELNDDDMVKHVKTGIWQVTCLDSDGTPQTPYYIVTGVCMEDKVDTKNLRKALWTGQKHSRRPKVSMAPTEIAEELAGFQSGTMAPICHSVNMKLFLEESIVADADTAAHKINVGSGMFGQCLQISADKFLQVAKMNPEGFQVCPLIRKAKKGKA